MGSIRTIATIARFEAIILFRSWFFRIFTVLILLFLLGMNIGILSETNSNWIIRALPANIPYFNMVFLNTAMTFIAMFLAIDFLRRDKKLDTSEVIYTRSMTNWDYVWGKTIGVLSVFLIVHLLVLLMALIINLAIPTAGLDLKAYIYYPLLISVPSLVFIMGFSFMIMSLVRNQAIALVVLLGYAGLVMFTAKDRFDYLFDFIGMRMPMMHSDFVGFGYDTVLFTQRAIYLTLGIAMIFGSVLLMKRLPQSRARTLFAWIMTGVFGVVGLSLAIGYYSSYQRNENYREKLIALNDQYNTYTAGKLKHTQINVAQEDAGLSITATLKLAFSEESDLKKAVFSLNPGFELMGITSDGKAVNYTREEHLALCDVSGLVDDNRELSLTFTYQGRADERLAYLDIDRKQIEEKYGPDFVVGIRKR